MNGILIALSPFLTDFPIVVAAIYALKAIEDVNYLLGILSFAGALFLLFLGVQNLRSSVATSAELVACQHSLRKGVITNFLSPHPYVFWITIGAPTFVKASSINTSAPYAFIFGFYLLLIGSKVFIALLTGRLKSFLQSSIYQYLVKISGLILMIFAVLLLYDGLCYLQ